VIYTTGTKIAEHGGAAKDDRHVAMLASAPGLAPRTIGERVNTTQIAPTILTVLGVSPDELRAVQIEGTGASGSTASSSPATGITLLKVDSSGRCR
jgi:hypothetical protein